MKNKRCTYLSRFCFLTYGAFLQASPLFQHTHRCSHKYKHTRMRTSTCVQVMMGKEVAEQVGGLKLLTPTGTSVLIEGELTPTPEGTKQVCTCSAACALASIQLQACTRLSSCMCVCAQCPEGPEQVRTGPQVW